MLSQGSCTAVFVLLFAVMGTLGSEPSRDESKQGNAWESSNAETFGQIWYA